jgi:hypothetical protein
MTNELLTADEAFDAIADELTARLAPSGWVRRRLGLFYLRTWTRPAGTAVIATVDIRRRRIGPGDVWPTSVTVRVGVGIGRVLDLLPLVALPPVATLVTDETDSPSVFVVRDARDVESVVEEIVSYVEANAAASTARFTTTEPIVDALARDVERDGRWSQRRQEIYLVALACAGGTGDAALALLPAYLRLYAHGALRYLPRRFARQLTRRIEAGMTTIPTAEQTIAALPWSSGPVDQPTEIEVKRRKDATLQTHVDVARQADRGTSASILRVRLRRSHARRNVYISPTHVAEVAEVIATSKRPLGFLRNVARWTGRHIGIALRRLGKPMIRCRPMPDWMRPPDTAVYVVPVPSPGTSNQPSAEVRIDDRVHDWLTHAWSTQRSGRRVAWLIAWLSRTPPEADDGTMTVFVGQQPIGTISAPDAALFADFARAAAVFDEHPVLPLYLVHTSDGVNIAQIPLPDRTEIHDDEAAFHLNWPNAADEPTTVARG